MTEQIGPIKYTQTINRISCGLGSDYCAHLSTKHEEVVEPYGERYMALVWLCTHPKFKEGKVIMGNECPSWCPVLKGEQS